jgi:hypothetical protein
MEQFCCTLAVLAVAELVWSSVSARPAQLVRLHERSMPRERESAVLCWQLAVIGFAFDLRIHMTSFR